MQKITPFLTYNDQAEEAVNLYTSVFKDARITGMNRASDGKLFSATFEIASQEFFALNGGPYFSFAPGISLFVHCQTQAEVDELWEKLSEGGEKQPCGWLKDKFGVSWQIIPDILSQYLSDKDSEKANRVMQAMLKMGKIEIAELVKAYEGK
jgi:predicted 3-demethylubiquinone-9 3-methyltransferase (glyoxalase superfamily)